MSKGPTICARWDGERLTYAAPIDLAELRKMEPCLFILKPYRGATDKQLRYLNVIVNLAVENSPVPTSREGILHAVKHIYGWYTDSTEVMPDGRVIVEVRSTADLDREELARFIDQTADFICTQVCPGMDPALLKREGEAQSRPNDRGRR